jgi:hypothetical protein
MLATLCFEILHNDGFQATTLIVIELGVDRA